MQAMKPFIRARLCAIFLFCSFGSFAFTQTAALAWDPASTRAVFLGVLEWEDSALATWPDAGRADAVLVDVLIARGLPKARISYLKNRQATKAASIKALDTALAASAHGETLIFYYCGHGSRSDGSTAFLPYDNLSAGTITAAWLGRHIAQGFKGERVILMGDCCYSGGLSEAADIISKAGKGALVLASVVSSSVSTGAWTFTESLVDVFAGKIQGDLGSGRIGIGAASSYLTENMRNADRQLALSYRSQSFPASFVLATESPPLLSVRPLYRLAQYKNQWYPVRILKTDGDRFLVHYQGWGAEWDEWLGPERLKLPEFLRIAPGKSVMVEWAGKWYPAKVLKEDSGFHFIHYEGYGPEWDEWVASPRIREK